MNILIVEDDDYKYKNMVRDLKAIVEDLNIFHGVLLPGNGNGDLIFHSATLSCSWTGPCGTQYADITLHYTIDRTGRK